MQKSIFKPECDNKKEHWTKQNLLNLRIQMSLSDFDGILAFHVFYDSEDMN